MLFSYVVFVHTQIYTLKFVVVDDIAKSANNKSENNINTLN